MNTNNLPPAIAQAFKALEPPSSIHVELPAKTRLQELVNNPPVEIWETSHKVIRWLDELKREVSKLK